MRPEAATADTVRLVLAHAARPAHAAGCITIRPWADLVDVLVRVGRQDAALARSVCREMSLLENAELADSLMAAIGGSAEAAEKAVAIGLRLGAQ